MYFDSSTVRIFAHRGFMWGSECVENTREAFVRALACGVGYIETDCRMTKDGKVVLFHDSTLKRVCGRAQKVSETCLRELEELFADRGGLLTLEGALEEFQEARFNVDVKSFRSAKAAGRMIARHSERVLVTSFHRKNRLEALREIARVGKKCVTSLDMNGMCRAILALRTGRAAAFARALDSVDALQIPEKYRGVRVLTPSLIEAVHALGKEIHVWTVNSAEKMRELIEMGIDGIVTDRADIAVKTLRENVESVSE